MSKLKEIINGLSPAPFWKFWNPMSGLIGGIICGSIVVLIVIIFYKIGNII